jgi:hypothetical protein
MKDSRMGKALITPIEIIDQRIILVRGQRVMLDVDLAGLYGVSTKALNQAVKRNIGRFPSDFMFELNNVEKKEVVTNCDHLKMMRFSHTLPKAFTEHGALMLAGVINSSIAVETSLFIVRAFVRLRETLYAHKELSHKLLELETKLTTHDEQIRIIIKTINQFLIPPDKPKRQIGFQVKEKIGKYRIKKI